MNETTRNLPVPSREALVAGARIEAIIPTTFEAVQRQALTIFDSGCAPKGTKKASDVTVLILAGLELGLPPMMAIQSLTLINGRVGVYGKLGLALVRKSGEVEYVKEYLTGTPYADDWTAHCEMKRKGVEEPVHTEFSVADAKRAGLWQEEAVVDKWVWEPDPAANYQKNKKVFKKGVPNDAPWYRWPKRMLPMRARGFALDDLFGDITRGFPLAENIDEEETPQSRAGIGAPPPIPEEIIDAETLTVTDDATLSVMQAAGVAGGATPHIPAADPLDDLTPVQLIDALEEELLLAPTPEMVEAVYAELDIEARLSAVHGGVDTARRLKGNRLAALARDHQDEGFAREVAETAPPAAQEAPQQAPAEGGVDPQVAPAEPATAPAGNPWRLSDGWFKWNPEEVLAMEAADQDRAVQRARAQFKADWERITALVKTPEDADRAEFLWRNSKWGRDAVPIEVPARLGINTALNDAIDAARGKR